MSNAVYASLARQQGLMQELQLVANNIANASTTGYKSDRAIFAEMVVGTGAETPSLSMGNLAAHAFQLEQGALDMTGATFDLAIQGEGFFAVETPAGQRLTRAGHFMRSADSQLVDPQGNAVLGAGGNPITIPEDAAAVSIAADGTLSVDGELIDQIGVFVPQGQLRRDSNTYFEAPEGTVPAELPNVVQGALEKSNVSPVLEVARMIDVQRAYEAGQALLEREDQRITQLIQSLRNQ